VLWLIARFRRTRVNTYTFVNGHFGLLICYECVQNVLQSYDGDFEVWIMWVNFPMKQKTKINTVVICKNEYITVSLTHYRPENRTPMSTDNTVKQTTNECKRSTIYRMPRLTRVLCSINSMDGSLLPPTRHILGWYYHRCGVSPVVVVDKWVTKWWHSIPIICRDG